MKFENLNRFACVNDQNKNILNKPHNQNVVYYSELRQCYTDNSFRSFSIKYTLEGTMFFKSQEKDYVVEQGQVLFTTKQPQVKGILDYTEKPLKSVCIDINDQTLGEVLTTLTINNDDVFDTLANGEYIIPDGIEKLTPLFALQKLDLLRSLLFHIRTNTEEINLNNEWFYLITEQMVKSIFENKIRKDKIIFNKKSTQTEIINRLNLAIDYMEENFLTINNNNEIAKHCMISEYHFIRMFHQRFGLPPHQFILKKRLNLAKYYLIHKDMCLTEIANHTGFADKHSLSKAFKKEFRINTSMLKLSQRMLD